MIGVLIADDHPMFRRGVAAVIDGDPDMHVVAQADSTDTAVQAAALNQPDVVLMDLAMPGGGGIEALRRIRAADADARVLMLTMSEDADAVFAALRAGARGYLLKDADKDAIRAAVAAVARGEAVFGQRIADKVVAFFANAATAGTTAFPQLSGREREVLDLIARGLDNRAIARRLVLSEKTVRNNVSTILTKLQVADRNQAIVTARDAGLGTTPG
jgi:DNA-binding NarL/FixJ family response regulator